MTDDSDEMFNPCWRQGMSVWPFCTRLGLLLGALGTFHSKSTGLDVGISSHTSLAGLVLLAGTWHWAFWDLDMFVLKQVLSLDLLRVFGIHLVLASSACFSFGYSHLTGALGPGFWTTDAFGLVGQVRGLKPSFAMTTLSTDSFGSLATHHLAAGCLGCFAGLWHSSALPGPTVAVAFSVSSIESALAASLPPMVLTASMVSSTAWYGAASSANELFGPTRLAWDSSGFEQELTTRSTQFTWPASPEQLLLYDYIGSNPAKGGLFRSGPVDNSDGIVQSWLGHVEFLDPTGNSLTVRRMPTFFETFPVILVDQAGEVQADLAFRRADARFSFESRGIRANLEGGMLGRQTLQTASLVKSLARKTQLGQIFTFTQVAGLAVDGVFRTSVRGWFTLAHSLFTFGSLEGHIWHGGRALFRDAWLGVLGSTNEAVEYGLNEKLGDM
jgi:photosystem II CP47 chlorophyll apoprotein